MCKEYVDKRMNLFGFFFLYIVSTYDNKSVSFTIFTIKQLVDFF